MDYLVRLSEFLRPHWNTIALVLTWAGIGIAYVRRRSQWRSKQFLARVNFSLNYVAGDSLAMRTLLETTANEVWLNDYGVGHVIAAARRAAVDQPFLMLPDPGDRDFVNRAVLNVLSERFAETYLAASLGQAVDIRPHVFGLTCEKYGDIRTLKLRVLIIEEQTLADLFGPTNRVATLTTSIPILRSRLTTLRIMYDLYQKDRSGDRPVLGHMELGVKA
jgi:hypothetical protein